MSNTYIFKLTPNNRLVVVNSSILLNGYKNVSYPVIVKNTSVIGYVLDPDTFKFVDTSIYNNFNKPYPVSIDVEFTIDNVRFYGVNMKYSTDAIVFKTPDLFKVNIAKKNEIYITKISRQVGTVYEIGYTLKICINWSDGSVTYPISETPEGQKPLSILFSINNKSDSVVQTHINPLQYPNNNTSITYDSDTDGTDNSYNVSWLKIADNIHKTQKHLGDITVSASFTDYSTMVTATGTATAPLILDPHVGQRDGFVKVSLVDPKPLEVWTPTLTEIYTKSVNNEANIKVDKDLYTEYYAFDVSGLLNIDDDNYKKTSVFFENAIPSEKVQLSKIKKGGIYSLCKNSSKINDYITPDELSEIIRADGNRLSYEKTNFYPFYSDDILDNNYDDSVFDTSDLKNFNKAFNEAQRTKIEEESLDEEPLKEEPLLYYEPKTEDLDKLNWADEPLRILLLTQGEKPNVNDSFRFDEYYNSFDTDSNDNVLKKQLDILRKLEEINTYARKLAIGLQFVCANILLQIMSIRQSGKPLVITNRRMVDNYKLYLNTSRELANTYNENNTAISICVDDGVKYEINKLLLGFENRTGLSITTQYAYIETNNTLIIKLDLELILITYKKVSTILAKLLDDTIKGDIFEKEITTRLGDIHTKYTDNGFFNCVGYDEYFSGDPLEMNETTIGALESSDLTSRNKVISLFNYFTHGFKKETYEGTSSSSGLPSIVDVYNDFIEAMDGKGLTNRLNKLLSPEFNSNIKSVIISGRIMAKYALYDFSNGKYQQVITKNTAFNDIETDYHIKDYKQYVDGETLDIIYNEDEYDNDSLVSYKTVYDEDEKLILYKHCINKIDVQIPVFGIYGVLTGYIPYKFTVYDYKTSHIPCVDLSDRNDIILHTESSYLINYDTLQQAYEDKTSIPFFEYEEYENSLISGWDFITNGDFLLPSLTDTSLNKPSYPGVFSAAPMLYSAAPSTSYTLKINADNELSSYLRINGVLLSLLNDNTMLSTVNPGVFVISLDDEYEFTEDKSISVDFCGTDSNYLLITEDEQNDDFKTYDNNGQAIGSNHSSLMLLRANPKLSGNIKLVVDSNYNLYLDTFKASPILHNSMYRKYPISNEGNYPRDVKTVFKSVPTNLLYATPENSLNSHKVYDDFNDQFETMYEYGAETNKDNLYSENMKLLAPIHIGDNVPEYFVIFRYDSKREQDFLDNSKLTDAEKLKELISESNVVNTFDLRQHTSVGSYLTNYKKLLNNYGQCYLLFIEQDYHKNSPAYRQGTNIWKGISVKRGILTDQSESTYFGSKILNSDAKNKQELFNNFIIQGFERNSLLYPNILNIEFMFNDETQDEYAMHRYFGLYLTANEFIKYGCVLSDDNSSVDNKFVKYDTTGNVYAGDNDLFSTIFTKLYSDRIFYAITNKNVARVQNTVDVNKFLNTSVKNKPAENILTLDASSVDFGNELKSFITLHFTKPLKYGEHLKFIALNYVEPGETYTNVNDASTHGDDLLPYKHIVYEIIASNDERLISTDNYISPYIATNKCNYSENTYFYRLSFYSQDINYKEVSATIEEQIKRIKACIDKFNTFISVGSYNKNSMSIVSKYDEMYIQHIDAPDLTDFKYDYVYFENMTTDVITTNRQYTNSVEFLTTKNVINDKVDTNSYDDQVIYDQTTDNNYDWLKDSTYTTDNNNWYCYVEAEDPLNIKYDSISYFNSTIKYKMHALTNKSEYFDGYYAAFSNYCFETLGWRYNNVVKFTSTTQFNNNYSVKTDILDFVNIVKYPLIYNHDKLYDTLNVFKIDNGYLRNNIVHPDDYEAYTSIQSFIFDILELTIVVNPLDMDSCMICTKNNSLQNNSKIYLYKPDSASIAIMGICNISDIDTVVDATNNIHMLTNLRIELETNTTIDVTSNNDFIRPGVMYKMVSGDLFVTHTTYLGTSKDNHINQGDMFILVPTKTSNGYKLYVDSIGDINNVRSIYSASNVIYEVCDRQCYQQYDYTTNIPKLTTDYYHSDIKNLSTPLIYPVVPSVNCNWKSNGFYYDFNNVLDVNNIKPDYEVIGNFSENVYTIGDKVPNQYVNSKIDGQLKVNGVYTTYKDCILNKTIQNPIRKLLIDNTNIYTSSVYYNSNIQSLEFIFFGVKFNIKLNSKIVNSYIHLDEYNDFDVFVVNDYDTTKVNELYISLVEKTLLIVNHHFYIDYAFEAENNIKTLDLEKTKYSAYAPYAVVKAPYELDFTSTGILSGLLVGHKKTSDLHKSLLQSIDKFNLWSSLFVLYDIPTIINDQTENLNMFVQAYIENISEYNDYVTIGNGQNRYNDVGVFSATYDVDLLATYFGKSLYSESNAIIITKADGDYKRQINNLTSIITDSIKTASTAHGGRTDKFTLSNIDKIKEKNKSLYDLTGKQVSMKQNDFNQLQEYVNKLTVPETHREKLLRYCKSVDDNIDIYIIPDTSDIRLIHNTTEYNPLLFNLTIPNQIKYNYGWFTPNTNDIVKYEINDELSDILDIDLQLCNTNIRDISFIQNYTGNKVYEDTLLTYLTRNYFEIESRSLLSTTWDSNYYRLYTNEKDFTYKEGHITGIDDKSFFGSKCMVINNPYILLDTWTYETANDLYNVHDIYALFNSNDTNSKQLEITINIDAVMTHYFINNKVFAENWNKFNETQVTGMKNYITNTMMSFYNMNSDLDIQLYAIDTDVDSHINIVNIKPENIKEYYVYENYSTHVEYKNNIHTLTIVLNETNGMNIYPTVKIYRK